MSEPQPIEPDPNATPARHHSRGFWRRDVLIWGAVLVVLAVLATWRLSTTGRGPEDASEHYPEAVGMRQPGVPPTGPPADAQPTLPRPGEGTGNP